MHKEWVFRQLMIPYRQEQRHIYGVISPFFNYYSWIACYKTLRHCSIVVVFEEVSIKDLNFSLRI